MQGRIHFCTLGGGGSFSNIAIVATVKSVSYEFTTNKSEHISKTILRQT